jgi:hypothetical protein
MKKYISKNKKSKVKNKKISKFKCNFGVHPSASHPGDGASDVVL